MVVPNRLRGYLAEPKRRSRIGGRGAGICPSRHPLLPRVWGLGFRVWGLGFGGGVWGLGFRVWDLGFGVQGLGSRVWVLGFMD